MKEKNYLLLKKKKNNNININIIMEYDSEIASKFYQNNRYRDQFETKSLLLDVTITSGDTSFMVHLPEELNINNVSDVYLDTLVTHGVKVNTSTLGFLVGIEQIEMKTVGGNSTDTSGGGDNKYNGRFFIPNEAGNTNPTIHKGRKLNYVGKIRPGKYHKVPITITDLDNGSIYNTSDSRFIAEFIIVEK